jgi:hypothetical protein
LKHVRCPIDGLSALRNGDERRSTHALHGMARNRFRYPNDSGFISSCACASLSSCLCSFDGLRWECPTQSNTFYVFKPGPPIMIFLKIYPICLQEKSRRRTPASSTRSRRLTARQLGRPGPPSTIRRRPDGRCLTASTRRRSRRTRRFAIICRHHSPPSHLPSLAAIIAITCCCGSLRAAAPPAERPNISLLSSRGRPAPRARALNCGRGLHEFSSWVRRSPVTCPAAHGSQNFCTIGLSGFLNTSLTHDFKEAVASM